MRRILTLILAMLLLRGALSGCGSDKKAPVIDDGRARPSNSGKLQVVNGKLCSESGEPVMLRGVSTNGLITAEDYINEPLFHELSEDRGVNLFRFAMYTYGVGIVGYCTGGDKDRR